LVLLRRHHAVRLRQVSFVSQHQFPLSVLHICQGIDDAVVNVRRVWRGQVRGSATDGGPKRWCG
jgi:hypothetical protein